MLTMQPDARRRPGDSLLRGGRWHLARPHSRALWTSASPPELAQLFSDRRLRRRLEDLLRVASAVLAEIDTLLVFDQASVELAVVIDQPRDGGDGYRWRWIAASLDGAPPPRETPAQRRCV